MHLVPYEKFKITTSKTTDEVYAVLKSIVEPRKNFNQDREKPFCGSFSKEKFKFVRCIRYRNSSLPVLNGKISSDGKCVNIEIRARIAVYACVFYGIGMAFLLYATVLGLIEREWTLSLIPFAIAVVLYLLMMLPFESELKAAKKKLNECFGE